ncbi:DUF2919 domain-containing protein [Vibrio mimicus]|uniref:DUF2919 domain-containing protein n=1 Tax=Vibrio mimicus TaxID=674 RepID=UPI000878DC99|nr:DUF2919 domain-containing protein [Vibrio mimicus]AOW81971.1 hypothetical protein VM_04225 [Vibrio mimicus]TXY06594.1 DUF2919 domain-containing protein [Vibrio mimicus]
MRYSIEQYDSQGFLKAPIWLWLGWLFLIRAWVMFVMAGVSREHGSRLLSLIYPDHSLLYVGLAMSVPILSLMWLITLRNHQRMWVNRIVAQGRAITLLIVIGQFVQTAFHVYLQHGAFHWANALTLVLLLWFGIYLVQSRHVQDSLQTPVLDKA